MLNSINSFPAAMWSAFSLIGLAELGDKSQLVCMALAVRYRAWPVLFGAVSAFAILNLAAVIFGAAIAHWLPERVIATIVGILFLLFGFHALKHIPEESAEEVVEKTSHGILLSTFLLIFVAELGDKTQIAVAALSSVLDPFAVWVGATLALLISSGLAIWVGRKLMQYFSLNLIHKISGSLFIGFGIVTLISGYFL